MLLPRFSHDLVTSLLPHVPVVFLGGARQVGKSTLAQEVARTSGIQTSVTLDARATLDAAAADPDAFIAGLPKPVLIDEVQRVPELLLAIKNDLDRARADGRFLLTGSANVLALPRVADALTGRLAVVPLWPLAQAEIESSRPHLVDDLFEGKPPTISGAPLGREAFVARAAAGGYPALRNVPPKPRGRLFRDYVDSTITRDLRDITDAHKLGEIPRLVRRLGTQAANLYVPSNIAKDLSITRATVATYTTLLEAVYLVRRLPAWRPGLAAREVQHPKLHFVDTGLLANLLGADASRLATDDQITGMLLENFVAMEFVKHLDWAEIDARAFHYRRDRDEVDLILEAASGEIVAVEVKARSRVTERDWRAIAKVRDQRGEQFAAGVVMYTGERTLPVSDRIWAVPVSALWAQH